MLYRGPYSTITSLLSYLISLITQSTSSLQYSANLLASSFKKIQKSSFRQLGSSSQGSSRLFFFKSRAFQMSTIDVVNSLIKLSFSNLFYKALYSLAKTYLGSKTSLVPSLLQTLVQDAQINRDFLARAIITYCLSIYSCLRIRLYSLLLSNTYA